MNNTQHEFGVKMDFQHILNTISTEVYESPLAFLRENVQNAIDAIRLRAHREGISLSNPELTIEISINENIVSVRDKGIGMTREDLENYYWNIGASGKRTEEAKRAGCVGKFGIGGFANFGVCTKLTVISQALGESSGTVTSLSESGFTKESNTLPRVQAGKSKDAEPNGTIVLGELRSGPNVIELRDYIREFVRYVPIQVLFDGEVISCEQFVKTDRNSFYKNISDVPVKWSGNSLEVGGQFFEDRGHTLSILLDSLVIDGRRCEISGQLRFEAGAVDIFKHGFKICTTKVLSSIGVSGRIDCDKFIPTAGRDTLDSGSARMLQNICNVLERGAVEIVFKDATRIAQHTRIFRYVVQHGLIDLMENTDVQLADGTTLPLKAISRKATQGKMQVYYGRARNNSLNQVMHAKGHVVVLLSSDRARANAERIFLENRCAAKPFEGIVECCEVYGELSRFEKVFLSELEHIIPKYYDLNNIRLIPGKLSEDIPVFVSETKQSDSIPIYIDVRHSEVTKLIPIGFTPILFSLISAFSRDYLGPTLKKWSPRFFGDGALNLELLAERRSELWVLIANEIGEIQSGRRNQVFTESDIHTVRVGDSRENLTSSTTPSHPKLLRIIDNDSENIIAGHYIRLLDSAYHAYGDIVTQCDSLAILWAGNRIAYVATDGVSTAFHYEIRLDRVISVEQNGEIIREGADEIPVPVQEQFESLYFFIPKKLEGFLVPSGLEEIRIELQCDWMDLHSAKQWTIHGKD